MSDVISKNRPDAELWTRLVDLDVTSRAELIGLKEGNNAGFTNWTQTKHVRALGEYHIVVISCFQLCERIIIVDFFDTACQCADVMALRGN